MNARATSSGRSVAEDLPTEDRLVSFGEVVCNVSKAEKDPIRAGLQRFVGLEHLVPGASRVESWGELTEGTTFTRRFRSGQVLFGKRRAYQRKAALVEFDGVCSGDILVFEADGEQLSPALLPHIVQSDAFLAHALRTSAGSMSPRTKWRDLADFPLRLPPLSRQEAMAGLLDEACAVTKTYGLAAKHARTVRDVIVAGLANGTEMALTVADVVKLARAGGTPSRANRDYFGGDIPWVKSGEVTSDAIMETEETLTREGLADSSAWLVPVGAVVVAMYGATAGQVGSLGRPMSTNQAVLSLIAAEGVADQRFLFHWLASRSVAMKRRAVGAAQPNLSKQRVLEEPFPSIPLEEQQRVARLLDDALQVERELKQRAEATATLTGSLREHLLTQDREAPSVY